MALLAVLAVLLALVLIATPFALQMQSAAKRSLSVLYTEEADQEAQNLFALANLYLLNTATDIERANLEKKADAFATPDWDTPDEFRIPREVIEAFNVNSARGRIWDVRVQDEQAKINVNSAPYTLLANLFGDTALAEDVDEGDTRITLEDASFLPEEDGLVRIGTELVRYRRRAGNVLEEVERGVQADRPWNSEPRAWKAGTLAMDPVAFEVATYPVRIREGSFTPFTNPYQVKRIHELGTTAMDPDFFDKNLEYLTTASGREVAGGWCNTQTLRTALPGPESDTGGDTIRVDDPVYFGPGTLVRITDGTHTDYSVVVRNNYNSIELGTRVKHEYEIDRARVETLARHPINLNTASDSVLTACLTHLALRVRGSADEVTETEAKDLIEKYFRRQPIKSLYHLKTILDEAVNDEVISRHDRNAIYLNALNPQDARLAFSTVPFCFKSYDTFTVKATAVVNSRSGEELARKSVRRVISVNPRRSTVWSVESQSDFESQIIASRDAKWMMTYPYNVGGQFDGVNIPPSRFIAHILRDIWPSDSRAPGVGDVRLMPERLMLANVFHYDDSHYADGYYIRDAALSYSTKLEQVDLVGDDGMRPLSVSWWYKPYWGGLGNTQYLLDCGEETWQNRVAVFYDAPNRELVLRVCDATFEHRATEIRYGIDAGEFEDRTWYHVTANVTGSKPSDLTLLVDGRAVGQATYMTRLTQSISPTGSVSEISVEDASSFPEEGALLVRGADGEEVFEYSSRSDTAFTVSRRFARLPLSRTGSDEYAGIGHEEGEVVTLLGYASPLVTDLPVGGATLPKDLGEWHAMKVTFGEDVLYIPASGGSSGSGSDRSRPEGSGSGSDGTVSPDDGGGGGAPTPSPGGAPPPTIPIQDPTPVVPGGGSDGAGGGGASGGSYIRGIAKDRTTVTLRMGEGIRPWDENVSDQEALAAFGEHGFALLVSPGPDRNLVPGEVIGGSEIVTYRKSGSTITIERYQATKQIMAAEPHFVPQHTYGSPDAKVNANFGDTTWPGIATALIPISVEVAGGGGELDYFDVVDDDELADPGVTRAFAQIGTEWIAYTYPDAGSAQGGALLVFDRPANITAVTNMFGGSSLTFTGGQGDGTATPPDAGGGGDGDDSPPTPTPPDDEPPNPEPPSPPPPEDDGGPGGGETPPPPDENPPPPGEDDGGPSGGETPPPPDPNPPPPGEDDGGPSGGETPTPPEPPLPPDEDDGGPGGGETPPPSPPGEDEPPPDTGGDDDGGETPPDAQEPSEPAGGNEGGRVPSDSGSAGDDVPFPETEIAARLQHRPLGDVTVADTASETHAAGDEVIPAFLIRDGVAGYKDRVTVAVGEDPVEELILQHNFQEKYGEYTLNWVAATSFVSERYERSENELGAIKARTVETRRVTRLLKFPSGELPTKVADEIRFGTRFDGGGVSQAFLDELHFRRSLNDEIYYLGDGGLLDDDGADAGSGSGESLPYLEAEEEEVKIHMRPTVGNPDGLPVTGLPEDGGVIRVNDEIIAYESLDTATGTLHHVLRGALGTVADRHSFGDRVTEMEGVTVALLDGGIGATASEIPLNRSDDFPRFGGGYVLIDDEIIGFTRVQNNRLVMPQDLRAAEEAPSDRSSGDEGEGTDGSGRTRQGPGIFRARYGTTAADHPDRSFVFYFPTRYPDRYVERSTDPETSSMIIRKRIDQAFWKRISWDEKIVDHTDVKVLVRFDGTPEWDSENIYNVNEGRVESGDPDEFRADPKRFLFRIDTPHGENRLNIQADRIEVRIAYQYEAGSFDPYQELPPNSWKDTPWLKALRLEYVAPVTVFYSEDVK